MSTSSSSEPTSIFSLTNHEVYLITSKHGDRENGQIATWVIPATLAAGTPRIVAIISKRNFTYELIHQSKMFVVHMLASDQHDLLPLFGLSSGREKNKFEDMQIERTQHGSPIIVGTCGWAECMIVDEMDSGDRIIYLADVIDQKVFSGKQPLHKVEAFMKQPEEIRTQLLEKAKRDGEKDWELMKKLR